MRQMRQRYAGSQKPRYLLFGQVSRCRVSRKASGLDRPAVRPDLYALTVAELFPRSDLVAWATKAADVVVCIRPA
jgi:hypothetical protein